MNNTLLSALLLACTLGITNSATAHATTLLPTGTRREWFGFQKRKTPVLFANSR